MCLLIYKVISRQLLLFREQDHVSSIDPGSGRMSQLGLREGSGTSMPTRSCLVPAGTTGPLGNSIVTLTAVTGAGKLPSQGPWKLDLNAT